MDIVFIVLLAIVQGLTEFLPISSSAHLVLFGELSGNGEYYQGIDIILHGASLLAVLCYFRKDLSRLIAAFFSRESSAERSMGYALLLGTVPIVVVGFFVYPVFSLLRSVPVVALALVVSGSLLILVDYGVRKGWMRTELRMWRRGVAVGLMQVFALLPGVSRSGITITAGRLVGFSRREAARFSFLLAIPAIVGALLLLCMQTPPFAASFGAMRVSVLLCGAGVAFVAAYAAVHFFLRFVERVGFLPFFMYQVVLGGLLLLFY